MLELNDDFEWADAPWGRVLRCCAIAAPHAFTTRALVLDADGWRSLRDLLGVTRVVRPRQVHGKTVTVVGTQGEATADAVLTNTVDTAAAVVAADCVPLLLFDPRTGAAGAVHAGWRGTAARIASTAVESMTRQFGSSPSDLIAAIGPSIGPCCYAVGGELLSEFGPDGRRWFYRLSDGWRLNLWAANRDQLVDAGLPTANVHLAELCTVKHPDEFPSYRRDGARAGRIAAAIRPTAGRGAT